MVTMNDTSAITGNATGDVGGGIYNDPNFATLNQPGGTISGNTPDDIYPFPT
jgi:hypothetical protein